MLKIELSTSDNTLLPVLFCSFYYSTLLFFHFVKSDMNLRLNGGWVSGQGEVEIQTKARLIPTLVGNNNCETFSSHCRGKHGFEHCTADGPSKARERKGLVIGGRRLETTPAVDLRFLR